MKVTQKQLTELLAQLGAGAVEIVDDESQSEFKPDAILQSIDENRTPIIRDRLKDGLSKETRGQFGGVLRAQLVKNSGISRSVLDKIEEDAEAIKAAFEYKLSLVEGDKEEVKNQLQAVLDQHAKDLQALTEQKDGEINSWRDKYVDRDMTDYYLSKQKDQPISEKADKSFIANLWKDAMKAQYSTKFDEARKAAQYYQKDKPDNLALNESGNGPIDDLIFLKDICTKLGVWETDTRNADPLKAMQDKQGAPYTPVIPGHGTNPGLADFNAERMQVMANLPQ